MKSAALPILMLYWFIFECGKTHAEETCQPPLQNKCPFQNKEPVEIGSDKKKRTSELQSVYWNPVSQEDVLACSRISDSTNGRFVCRTKHENNWRLGHLKVAKDSCNVACDIAMNGKGVAVPLDNNKNTHLLIYHSPGKWKPYDSFLDNALVYGGVFDDGEPAYLCRYKHDDGKLYIGRYSVPKKQCWILPDVDSEEIRGNDKKRIEFFISFMS